MLMGLLLAKTRVDGQLENDDRIILHPLTPWHNAGVWQRNAQTDRHVLSR